MKCCERRKGGAELGAQEIAKYQIPESVSANAASGLSVAAFHRLCAEALLAPGEESLPTRRYSDRRCVIDLREDDRARGKSVSMGLLATR